MQRPPLQVVQDSGQPATASPSRTRPKQTSLANIAVQSFAAFRAQTSSIPAASPVRRKPLPANASPGRLSSAEFSTLPRSERRQHAPRSFSVDSPPLQSLDQARLQPPQLSSTAELLVPRDLDKNPHGFTPLIPPARPDSIASETAPQENHSPVHATAPGSIYSSNARPNYNRAISSYHTARLSISSEEDDEEEEEQYGGISGHTRSANMSSYNQPVAPNLTLQLDGTTGQFTEDSDDTETAGTAARPPKSPGRFTSFFGWRSSPQSFGTESPTTTFSDRALSPAPSPSLTKFPHNGVNASKPAPAVLDIPKTNAAAHSLYFNVPGTPLLSTSPTTNTHVEELERELKEVSSELANSIRREMELEDEVERLRNEAPTTVNEVNRRTSDYFSDSSTSSVRYQLGDSDSKIEELERLRRKAEQDKAQIKVDMAQKLQHELRCRRDLEAHVQFLEERLGAQAKGQADPARENEHIRELESALDDARRRLAEERRSKENYEDLFPALQQDLEQHRNERDNLRDEVVPQLQARIEGLEAEAVEMQTLTYENTRMQQELQALRDDNQTLTTARRMQQEMQQQQARFRSIAEEDETADMAHSPKIGLSRSNSLARSSALNSKRGSLSRSSSVRDRSEPRDPLSDRIKDIEDQRDALHRALKSLLQRHEYQEREHTKRIRALEVERDRAMNLSPRRSAFQREVAHLKDEVTVLRRRADEALEQKWRCEKGLSGLKMDLDRAEQETGSLRALLQEHETDDNLGQASTEAERTMQLLTQSISDAEAERDRAQQEAEDYRQQARALQQSEMEHLSKEHTLATELYASASRMDELAVQVQGQLRSNGELRQRLAEAVLRGEKEQKASATRIVAMQGKLKALEDKVMVAQQHSEDVVATHEDEVRELRDLHNAQLQRARAGMLSPARAVPASNPSSPLFALKSPRVGKTSIGLGVSMTEESKTELLEKRVGDLEKALSDAEKEMGEVVSRMNMAQIEVAELQSERDEAMRQTRRLQAEILAEREKVRTLMS